MDLHKPGQQRDQVHHPNDNDDDDDDDDEEEEDYEMQLADLLRRNREDDDDDNNNNNKYGSDVTEALDQDVADMEKSMALDFDRLRDYEVALHKELDELEGSLDNASRYKQIFGESMNHVSIADIRSNSSSSDNSPIGSASNTPPPPPEPPFGSVGQLKVPGPKNRRSSFQHLARMRSRRNSDRFLEQDLTMLSEEGEDEDNNMEYDLDSSSQTSTKSLVLRPLHQKKNKSSSGGGGGMTRSKSMSDNLRALSVASDMLSAVTFPKNNNSNDQDITNNNNNSDSDEDSDEIDLMEEFHFDVRDAQKEPTECELEGDVFEGIDQNIAFEFTHLHDYEDEITRELDLFDHEDDAMRYKHLFGESSRSIAKSNSRSPLSPQSRSPARSNSPAAPSSSSSSSTRGLTRSTSSSSLAKMTPSRSLNDILNTSNHSSTSSSSAKSGGSVQSWSPSSSARWDRKRGGRGPVPTPSPRSNTPEHATQRDGLPSSAFRPVRRMRPRRRSLQRILQRNLETTPEERVLGDDDDDDNDDHDNKTSERSVRTPDLVIDTDGLSSSNPQLTTTTPPGAAASAAVSKRKRSPTEIDMERYAAKEISLSRDDSAPKEIVFPARLALQVGNNNNNNNNIPNLSSSSSARKLVKIDISGPRSDIASFAESCAESSHSGSLRGVRTRAAKQLTIVQQIAKLLYGESEPLVTKRNGWVSGYILNHTTLTVVLTFLLVGSKWYTDRLSPAATATTASHHHH